MGAVAVLREIDAECVRAEALTMLRGGAPHDDGGTRWFVDTVRRAVTNVRRQRSWAERTKR